MNNKTYLVVLIFFVLLISISGCSRDMANQIAIKELDSKNIPTNETAHSTTIYELLNGDYDVNIQDEENESCSYLISIKYDGSKVLKTKHICAK